MPFVGYHGGAEQFAPSELIDFAVAAEAAGFQGMTLSDHFHPWQENQGHASHAWLTLAAIGQRTAELQIGTGVACPIYRYRPAEVAQAFATLALLHTDRVFLGVGTGEALNELSAGGGWGPHRERLARLEEAITLIHRLWSGDWVDFEGEYYRVQNARLFDRPKTTPPIYVAASGRRAAGLAGRLGDGWVTDIGTMRDPASLARVAFEEAARNAGKDPASMPVLTELWAVVGTRDDALDAARLWRFIPAFNDVVNVPDPREVQRIAEERVSLERAVEGWVISEDPDDHVAAIRDLADRGVTHVFIHPPQADQRAIIEFYGREVLPALLR